MKNFKHIVGALAVSAILIVVGIYILDLDMVVLNPKGLIGRKEHQLIVISTWLMLIVVLPVFALTFWIAYKYRAGNKKAKYTPDWDHNSLAEIIWWGIPFIIIVVLSVLNWIACFDLDPFKSIESKNKPITIQVVALDWKWLFIYPEQKIAVVNLVEFPANTPVRFEITADAPMNSFWIPELGGQIFAMPGMRTELHLIADEEGEYRGVSANLSGKGFSGMTFTAKATSEVDFNKWVRSVRRSKNPLTKESFLALAKPSEREPVTFYTIKDPALFDWIVMKDMMPPQEGASHAK